MLADPIADDAGLTGKPLFPQFAPELGAIATALLPALL
jgi:hypothetical protein